MALVTIKCELQLNLVADFPQKDGTNVFALNEVHAFIDVPIDA